MVKTPSETSLQNHEICLIGAVVRAPELRYTARGFPVLEATVGGTEMIKTDIEEKPLPFYQAFKVLGAGAERWADRLQMGQGVVLIGRLNFQSWIKDGRPASRLEVVARRLEVFALNEGDLVEPDSRGGRRASFGSNRVWAVGNLTRDCELRFTSQGQALAQMRIAINEGEKAHYVEVQGWRLLAERMSGWQKGQRVYVEGRLVSDSWTASDGQRRYTVRIEAQRAYPLERFPSPQANRSPVEMEERLEEDFPPVEELPF